MMRSNITGTTHSPVARWRVDERERGFGVELAAGDDRAGHRRGEHQLREAPGVEHRRDDDGDFLGAPRGPVEDRLERLGSAAGVPGALGRSGGARRQQDRARLAARRGRAVRRRATRISFSTVRPSAAVSVQATIRTVSGCVGQCAVDGGGELLVVDHHVGALARHHLGHRGTGERGVEQQHVGADPVGGDQGFDEAAVVARHDPDDHPGAPPTLGLGRRAAPAGLRRARPRVRRFRDRSACRARRRGRGGPGIAAPRPRNPK